MSERLLTALDEVKSFQTITLGKIVDHIKEEALVILSLISIMPFLQPVPVPGLSSILGFIVLLQGVGLTFWGKPLLTNKLKSVVISHDLFAKIQKVAIKFSAFTSKMSAFKHPFANSRPSQILCGISIIVSAAFLSLPLPIPLSNLIPALSIFLICVGLLEEDLFLILCGHGIAATIIWMGIFSYQFIKEQLQALF